MDQIESAGGIVFNTAGQILVVSQYGTSWSLPKGQIEAGEDRLTAARREIHEESGITELELIRDLGSYQRPRLSADGTEESDRIKIIHMFLFTTTQVKLCPIDPDNPEARWMDKTEVAGLLTHPKDREFFLQAINC